MRLEICSRPQNDAARAEIFISEKRRIIGKDTRTSLIACCLGKLPIAVQPNTAFMIPQPMQNQVGFWKSSWSDRDQLQTLEDNPRAPGLWKPMHPIFFATQRLPASVLRRISSCSEVT